MAKLSVNLNKIALLRNARITGVPDLVHFGRLAHQAGADGLTVHPRPDERHILEKDVFALADLMAPWRPGFEFNIEGNPDPRLMRIVAAIRPEQVTLVPDPPGVLTSDAGWRLDQSDQDVAAAALAELRALGCRPILFVDPDPTIVPRAAKLGAAGIEIYTGGYATAFRRNQHAPSLSAIGDTAKSATALGLIVNAGHDLTCPNIPPLLAAAPSLAEASIGHELTADALENGWIPAIQAYRRVLRGDSS